MGCFTRTASRRCFCSHLSLSGRWEPPALYQGLHSGFSGGLYDPVSTACPESRPQAAWQI